MKKMDAVHSFPVLMQTIGRAILFEGDPVDTGHWQALKDVPNTKTIELTNVDLEIPIPPTIEVLQENIKPNLPWAEDHFQERVGGVPTNPGEQYKNWPWYKEGWEAQSDGKFSHTYQERFWPRWAGIAKTDAYPPGWATKGMGIPGIRYRYGDLNDLVDLLAREPHTRQAYLPIWFPEDTGAHHGGRVPCSLGYHFLLRDGRLHCSYFIRSCDFLRYFQDDAYMAARLTQWVIRAAKDLLVSQQSYDYELWHDAKPGNLNMHIVSLHVFEGDLQKMRRLYG